VSSTHEMDRGPGHSRWATRTPSGDKITDSSCSLDQARASGMHASAGILCVLRERRRRSLPPGFQPGLIVSWDDQRVWPRPRIWPNPMFGKNFPFSKVALPLGVPCCCVHATSRR
jgi:hypothetical protein